ncbi:UNVERIFIED_CONTAM: GATA transcription factor 9 [Sesamum latifolium]|uniref:GATA transcription factor 9 n=1 Tax=Sesamum latifolium TaxID=2727402 RepID=A0AAW2XKN1_9LAMI
MEWIEARALKSSVLSQMAGKTNAPVIYNDELWRAAFLRNTMKKKVAQGRNSNPSSSTLSGADEIDSLSVVELAVPVDELENLEWLSQFVDDSTSELSFLYSAGSFIETVGFNSGNRVEALSSPVQNIPVSPFPFPVPRKARSKRPRADERRWSSADSYSTSSSYASSAFPSTLFTNPVLETDWFYSMEQPPAKKQKRKPEADSGPAAGRKCTHCQVHKDSPVANRPAGPKNAV